MPADLSDSSGSDVAEPGMRESEFVGSWAGRGYRHLDAADADADQRPDLQQLEAEGAAGGLGGLGMRQADAAQRADEHGRPRRRTIAAAGWPASPLRMCARRRGLPPPGQTPPTSA